MLAPFLSQEMAESYPPSSLDPDGAYAPWRLNISPFAYNTNLVKEADAPKSFKDLLDPKWKKKICIVETIYEWYLGMQKYIFTKRSRAPSNVFEPTTNLMLTQMRNHIQFPADLGEQVTSKRL